MAQRELQNSESGARARRKHACDANAIWETLHMSADLQMKGARDDNTIIMQINSDEPLKWAIDAHAASIHSDIRCWRDIWDIPHDPVGCIRSAAMFYVVPVATIMETMFYMGLRATSECRSWRP
eukprot:6214415-Pleurochrysis_carterae.AAC.3